MKNQILIGLMFVNLFVNAQTATTNSTRSSSSSVEENFKIETDKIFDKLVKIRRTFHAAPELAGKEVTTQQVIKQYLVALGLEVKTDIYGSGIVGILKGAKKRKEYCLAR